MSISSRRAAAAKLFTAAGPFTRAVQRRSIAAVEHSKIVHGKSCVCCAVPRRGYVVTLGDTTALAAWLRS